MAIQLKGKKIGMTHIWKDDKMIPVTVVLVPTATVIEKKDPKKHGYQAIRVASSVVDSKKLNKPDAGQYKNLEQTYQWLYEIRGIEKEVNDKIDVSLFSEGEKIKLTGISRGMGFQGAMKRHNFSGGNDSHGSMSHRRTGSIGCRLTPGRVFKNRKMPGHMGTNVTTELGKEIIQIIPEKELILIKGSVPGAKNSAVYLKKWERAS